MFLDYDYDDFWIKFEKQSSFWLRRSDFESKKKENHQNFTRKTSSRISSTFKNYEWVKTPFLAFFRPVFGSQSLNMAWEAPIWPVIKPPRSDWHLCQVSSKSDHFWNLLKRPDIAEKVKISKFWILGENFWNFFLCLISSVGVSRSLMPNFRLKKTKNEPENPF